MMDQSRGRNQTTRGIWLDCARKVRDVVVMDLEGTDSGERGEDRGSFERQTGLYGLALAEVLMINMWHHDIGRYTASNYGILRTVFEVNLQLFGARTKTTILFVVRDHEADTPLDALKTKILGEMAAIWAELRKPDDLVDAPIESLFSFAFFALPHLKHEAALFEMRVDELRAWFAVPASEAYLLQRPETPAHRAKTVPADGFGQYAQQVWTTVREHKELNLPTQRAMLATFRCEEFAGVAAADFQKSVAPLLARVATALQSTFGAEANHALEAACHAFDAAARGYDEEVAARKRDELRIKLVDSLRAAFAQNVQYAVGSSGAEFVRALDADAPAGAVWKGDNFAALVERLRDVALASLQAAVEASRVGSAEWTTHAEEGELRRTIESAAAARRKELIQLVVGAEKERLVDRELPGKVTSWFAKYPEDMWPRIRKTFADACHDSEGAQLCAHLN